MSTRYKYIDAPAGVLLPWRLRKELTPLPDHLAIALHTPGDSAGPYQEKGVSGKPPGNWGFLILSIKSFATTRKRFV